jgi:hypothetical protein
VNLRDNPESVLKALIIVEGVDWLKRQKDGQFKGYSVYEAMEKLEGLSSSRMPLAVIYGKDGWNRYRVLASGEVEFIEAQALGKEAVKKAREAGFTIF